MANNLFTFGCSYTAEYYDANPLFFQYKNFNNGVYPKTWPQLLAEKLNLNLYNFGRGASGNDEIFYSFCKNCDKISEGDVVVIGWSYNSRFLWADVNSNNWTQLGPSKAEEDVISQSTLDEIIVNRSHDLYHTIIFNYEKLINELADKKKFEVYYWYNDDIIIDENNSSPNRRLLSDMIATHNLNNKSYYESTFNILILNGCTSIKKETDNLIDDGHNGGSGHIVQSEFFYNHIKKYSKLLNE